MKNNRIVAGIIGAVIALILFGSNSAVNLITDAQSGNQTQLTCSNQLRQSMDVMHMQMQMVETSGDVDEDFVRLMLPHHAAAVEMAKVELRCGKDQINRRLAQEIIADQQSEIELMCLWLSKRESMIAPPSEPQKEEKKQ